MKRTKTIHKDYLTLEDLLEIRYEMILEGKSLQEINSVIRDCKNLLVEDTSGTGGPAGAAGSSSMGMGGGGVAYGSAVTAGMGGVVSSQPSSNAGVTLDPGFTSGGGSVGSGDISVPYNPGGRKKAFQKIPVDNRKGTNKRRKNKMLAGLRQALGSRQNFMAGQDSSGTSGRKSKVMNFSDFQKDDVNRVTKVTQ